MPPKRKVTDAKAIKAREMHNAGMSLCKIGAALGVSHETIRYTLNVQVREQNCLRAARWYKDHKEERRIYSAEWYKNHKEEEAAYRKNHKEEAAAWRRDHKEERHLYDVIYRKNHKEELEKYRKNRLPERAAYQAARRTKVREMTAGDSEKIKEIYRRAKEDPKIRCYLCGKLIPMGHRHVDHIVPLDKGGAHRSSNLAITHGTCNMKKHNKLPKEAGLLL